MSNFANCSIPLLRIYPQYINLQQNPTLSTMMNLPSPSSCHHVISTGISKGPVMFATKIVGTASFTSEAFRCPATTRSISVTYSFVSSRRLISTLRTSLITPDSGNLADHEHPLPQSQTVSTTPLQQFKALKLADVTVSLQSKRKRKLKYYTYLAGQLAGEGRLLEFAELLQVYKLISFSIVFQKYPKPNDPVLWGL